MNGFGMNYATSFLNTFQNNLMAVLGTVVMRWIETPLQRTVVRMVPGNAGVATALGLTDSMKFIIWKTLGRNGAGNGGL